MSETRKAKGIGSQLYVQLFEEFSETDIHAVVAGIALPNDASIQFSRKIGF